MQHVKFNLAYECLVELDYRRICKQLDIYVLKDLSREGYVPAQIARESAAKAHALKLLTCLLIAATGSIVTSLFTEQGRCRAACCRLRRLHSPLPCSHCYAGSVYTVVYTVHLVRVRLGPEREFVARRKSLQLRGNVTAPQVWTGVRKS